MKIKSMFLRQAGKALFLSMTIVSFNALAQSTVPWVEESHSITPDAAYSGKTLYLKADNGGRPRVQIESEWGTPDGGYGVAQLGSFKQYVNSTKTQYRELRFLELNPSSSFMLRGTSYISSTSAHKVVFEVGSSGQLTLGYDINSTVSMLSVRGRASITNTLAIGGGGVVVPAGYRLAVKDGIITEKLKVAVAGTADWADYVFADDYKLMPLEQVEKFVKENNHLPNVPSAVEVVESGIDVAKMDAKLLEKIEELTLYIIQQQKEINELKTLIK